MAKTAQKIIGNSAKDASLAKDRKDTAASKAPVISIPAKDFDELKKTYDLPDTGITSTIIIHKMAETLEVYLKIVQEILQPEEFHALYECSAFPDSDKPRLFELYKRMMIAHRELLKVLILSDEKSSLSAIQSVHKEISSIKPQMIDILEKMQQSWKDSGKDRQRGPKQYFG